MAVEEKPLLPHSQDPPLADAPFGAASSIVTKTRRAWMMLTSSFGRSWGSRRRWLMACAIYALVGLAWHFGLARIVRRLDVQVPASLRWKQPHTTFGGRAVYNALGERFAFADTSAGLPVSAVANDDGGSVTNAPTSKADAVYHLYPKGPDASLADYLTILESFLRTHFPARDSDESDPASLINALRSYFPTSSSARWPAGSIPHKVWQTAPDAQRFAAREGNMGSWLAKNPGWEVERQDNDAADRWVRERFGLSADGENVNATRGVVAAWDRLAEPEVLRSDFWRYLVLAVEGGVYADTDVECLKPFDQWADDVSWEGERPSGWQPPALIVGIESDVGTRADWNQYWPRPLQVAQWTMASARGHPVMLDAVRRTVETALLPATQQPHSVMERTGPGLWTDAVLSYLWVMYRRSWTSFRDLKSDGWRFREAEGVSPLLNPAEAQDSQHTERWGDVKLLSITGFSPGIGHMGAHDKSHRAAMASHGFAGSWLKQKGADA